MLHAVFFFRQELAGIFFKSPIPPSKGSAPQHKKNEHNPFFFWLCHICVKWERVWNNCKHKVVNQLAILCLCYCAYVCLYACVLASPLVSGSVILTLMCVIIHVYVLEKTSLNSNEKHSTLITDKKYPSR